MRKFWFYLIAVLLLAGIYPVLQQYYGTGWMYFLVILIIMVFTRFLAEKYGRKK